MSKKKRKKVENKNIVTNDLDSTEELDVSFIDTKSNDKKKKMVRQTLEKGRKEIAEQKNNDISENNNNSSSDCN